MNASLTCENCLKYFNTHANKPHLISCCQDTLCHACWLQGFKEDGSFTCPFKCKEEGKES